MFGSPPRRKGSEMSDELITVQQIIDRSSHCMVQDGTGKWHSAVKAKISDLRQLENEAADALERVTREKDEWRKDFNTLCHAIVGNTGLSAIEEAGKLKQRAQAAEAEVERLRADAARLDFLQSRLHGVDFAYGEDPAIAVITIRWPDTPVGADLRANIDAAIEK